MPADKREYFLNFEFLLICQLAVKSLVNNQLKIGPKILLLYECTHNLQGRPRDLIEYSFIL